MHAPDSDRRPPVLRPTKTIALVVASLVLFVVARQCSYVDNANLVQGLSISTEAKYVVEEYWAIMGELPCETGRLDFRVSPDRGKSVLSAVGVTDCGQVTLLYNEDSGLAGRRMVLQAEEINGALGVELAWRCWTPDFPDIEKRIAQCKYEDRQLASINIPDAPEESPQQDNSTSTVAPVTVAARTDKSCIARAAIYRPVFTDAVQKRLPQNQIVSYGPGREQLAFFTEVIGASGKQIDHKWFFNDIAIGDYSIDVKSDRWPTWSSRSLNGLDDGTLRVEVYDKACLIGKATIQSQTEKVAEPIELGGFMPPKLALEKTLSKPRIDYATTADRNSFVDDLTDNGDTILLAAIRSGDAAEALKLINRVTPPEPPPNMRAKEVNTFLGRYRGRADPFLRDANGVSPINLAHQLGRETLVEALIQSAISYGTARSRVKKVTSFEDGVIKTLLSNDGGLTRFDDGDTPLHRAVRNNNERAVLTMLRLTGWDEQTEPYNPAVDIYAYDRAGRSAMTIANEEGFYAIERFMALAMTRKSPGWAVSRATFATHMNGSEPGDCRDTAFADEKRLYFFTDMSDMDGKRIVHEWHFNRDPVHRVEFEVSGDHWSGHSSRDFSAADVGLWEARVVSEAGEVLRTRRLHYQEVTDDNRRNRKRFLGPCNLGSTVLYSLVKAWAPVSTLDYLLGKGTEVKPGSSLEKDLVSQAIVDGNIRLVGWFLERGLDIEGYLPNAATPLLLAVKNGRDAMALYLITRGADVSFRRNRDGLSALQLSVVDWNADLAAILLEHGADPNTQSNRGYTSLYGAIMHCDVPTILTLLEHGADPGFANDRGETPRDNLPQCDSRDSWDPQLAGLSSLYQD